MAEKPPSLQALTDAILFTGETFIEGHALVIQDGHVLDIVRQDKLPAEAEPVFCAGRILAPGFIDCQVNGGDNRLFNEEPSAATALAIAAAHRKTGTTRLLPTLITDRAEKADEAIAALREAKRLDPSLLGIHLEGPHIGTENKGIHNDAFIRPLTDDDIDRYAPQGDEIALVTLAPESAAPHRIRQLVGRGAIVSLGHTNATGEEIHAALTAGASCFTHLFNGMAPLRARAPGPAAFALDDRSSFCGLIADGYHVAPEMIRLAIRAKPMSRLFLVSDAMPPAGADDPKPFFLNGERIAPDNGVCRNAESRIAGAMKTLGEIVSYAIRDLKLEPERVLHMASFVPAAFLGVSDRLGHLQPGAEADIVALDHFFKAQTVWRGGERVWG